jgi:hypothetical protein
MITRQTKCLRQSRNEDEGKTRERKRKQQGRERKENATEAEWKEKDTSALWLKNFFQKIYSFPLAFSFWTPTLFIIASKEAQRRRQIITIHWSKRSQRREGCCLRYGSRT